MTKSDWVNIWLIVQDAYKKDRMRIICMIVMALMEVLRAYIDIYILGKIVDFLYVGFEAKNIILYVIKDIKVRKQQEY